MVADDVYLFGKEYFSVPTFDQCKGYSRHHGSNLWKDRNGKTSRIKTGLRKLLGEVVYYKIISYKVCVSNEFYQTYKLHKRKRSPR